MHHTPLFGGKKRLRNQHFSKGFTFIEILVVIAIVGIITSISYATFRAVYRTSAVRAAVLSVADSLREARNNTLGAQADSVYGVRVSTSSVTQFRGSTYIAGATTNEVYVFEGGVTATGTLVTNGTNIVFAHLSGLPSATGTITVQDSDQTSSTTLTIYGTGLVEY